MDQSFTKPAVEPIVEQDLIPEQNESFVKFVSCNNGTDITISNKA